MSESMPVKQQVDVSKGTCAHRNLHILAYKEGVWAERCEDFCTRYKALSLPITSHGVQGSKYCYVRAHAAPSELDC